MSLAGCAQKVLGQVIKERSQSFFKPTNVKPDFPFQSILHAFIYFATVTVLSSPTRKYPLGCVLVYT